MFLLIKPTLNKVYFTLLLGESTNNWWIPLITSNPGFDIFLNVHLDKPVNKQ